jgi:hypothetical protein
MTSSHDDDQADGDTTGGDETSTIKVGGPVGTPPRTETPQRRPMIAQGGAS